MPIAGSGAAGKSFFALSTAPVLSAPDVAVPPVPFFAELQFASVSEETAAIACTSVEANSLHGVLGVALSDVVCVALFHLVYGAFVVWVEVRLRL